jgi:hypothetical protein
MGEKELTEELTAMLGGIAGVKVKARGSRANYTVGGKEKMFAFTQKKGVVLKLPGERVRQLVEGRGASGLVMGKKTMKEWVVMPYADAAELRKDLKLMKEAMKFAELRG